MKKREIERQSLLSALWIFILFNIIFRDLHQFAHQGFVQELMSLKIDEELMLVFGFVVEIPIAMVLLSRILRDKVNKWVNLFAVVATFLGLLSALPSADMDDLFFAVMESAALVIIVAVSWQLPTRKMIHI